MVTDVRASKMFRFLREGDSVRSISRKLKMSEKTVRKYRDADLLPSQIERPERNYRTRPDPLTEFWPEIETLLQGDPKLKPYAILDWLKQKYNPPASEPRVTDSIRRTLERRVQSWKLEHGVEQEVKFPQVHHAGDLIAFDFVVMNELKITLGGKLFEHLMFHAVLTYSNWEHVHLCHSESFEALSAGLQDALHLAGGVPRRVRSDSLSAAVNNLSSDKEFATQYHDLLEHYGVRGHRINIRKPHENGDVESSHGHFKDAVDQALRLRGSRDFVSVDEYLAFVRQLIQRRNSAREQRFAEDVDGLSPLPAQRRSTCTSIPVTVPSDSVIRVKRNAYSVSSKYVGLKLEVRIHQDHLELWYRNERLEQLPRQSGVGKEDIDFRHVIDSLVRKPGAFINYRYANHMYPTTRFRMAYDQLLQNATEASAVKQYLQLLYAAKHEGLELVDDVLRWFFAEGKPINTADVLQIVASKQQLPAPTEVVVEAPDLSTFDALLQHKEVYDDPQTNPTDSQTNPTEGENEGGELDAYDRCLETFGPTEGVAASDISRESPSDGGTSSSRSMDVHAVPRASGRTGMPVEDAGPHCASDAQSQSFGGEDVGGVRVVSAAAAHHTAIRDTSQRRLLEPPRQLADLREARLGKDDAALGARRSTGEAGAIGLLFHLSDVGAVAVAGQAGPATGTGDQTAAKVRSPDHRRPGLRPAEPRGDGSLVHPALGTVRTRQRAGQFEPAVFQMGADLQGSHDNGRGDRPTDPSLGDHRTQHFQLPTGSSQKEATQSKPIKGGIRAIAALLFRRAF